MAPRPVFPEELRPDADGVVARGGEISVDVLLEAYPRGIFPWTGKHPIPWCAPDPRMVLYPRDFAASRSLRRLARTRRYVVRFDTDFESTLAACAQTPRPGQGGTWITPNMAVAYTELARRGIAHSVEVYRGSALVGGLYGLSLGRAFFGESMFYREPNTSKLALWVLCERLVERSFHFIDCQAVTPHLKRLGARAIPLRDYLLGLERALALPSVPGPWLDW
jgi:leucyl/phenylalanyl-tRNA--protein transferase